MLASIFSLNVLQTALELGCIYGLVALALFLSYSILNIADLSTDGCFTLGCAVACQVALTGHPILALAAAMAAGVCSENGADFSVCKTEKRQWGCGFANAHLYAGFPHLYWVGTALPRRFVQAAQHFLKHKG